MGLFKNMRDRREARERKRNRVDARERGGQPIKNESRDGKQTVLDALQATKNELAHVDAMADLINDGLSTLRDLPGSTVAFNKAARKQGETEITFHIDAPEGAVKDKTHYRQHGTYISIESDKIYLLEHNATHDEYSSSGDFYPSTPEGAAKVLDNVSRTAVLHRQIP